MPEITIVDFFPMIKYFLKPKRGNFQIYTKLPYTIFNRCIFIFICIFSIISGNYSSAQDPGKLILPDHPRLIFFSSDETILRQRISENKHIAALHKVILDSADNMIYEKPVVYKKTGRRLLKVSRTCLRRVLFLSYSYRITNDRKYLKRAEQEMLMVAGFKDWNPDHFLDVAEMTTALAIGYDWLYDDLSRKSRKKIRNAIISKGLLPSRMSQYNGWLQRTNNWNQVCNGGLSLGAMAIYESEPELAQEIIKRARKSIILPQLDYEPDGAYPEGSMYWAYGTMYNVLFIDAYRGIFGSRDSLELGQGFMQSGYYFLHVFGPAGSFNYADCSSKNEFTPALFWYASELKDNTVLYYQSRLIDELSDTAAYNVREAGRDRFLPMIPIWASKLENLEINEPAEKSWSGLGPNPVGLHRTSWDYDGIFIGIKGGSPALSHAHMDIGSFVMDADGVRWALDLGSHDYYQLESKGLDIWNREQNSDRWKVFRYSNFSHNTLTVDNALQSAECYGTILKTSNINEFRSTVLDITSAYKEKFTYALRGIAIADNNRVIVRDEVMNADTSSTVRWAMLTYDNIEIISDHQAVIRKGNKELTFLVVEPQNVKIQTYSSNPQNEFEEKNPGTVMIGFELNLQANEEKTLCVVLIPGNNIYSDRFNNKKLSDW